jgi:mRNA interferase MazF
MVIQRGEIWWAELKEPAGSGPGFRRPIVVIQSDDFNRSRIQTIIAVAITSNLRLAKAPGNVLLSKKQTGLPKESVANISQLITIDKSFLTKRVSRLSPPLLRQIEKGLKLVLSI